MTPKTYERFIFASDNHGSHVCNKSAGVLFDFIDQWNPTVRIHGGDCFDFAALRKGASDTERREKLQDDLDAGLAFIDKFKPTHFLRGNHDERLWDLADSGEGPLVDLANSYISDIEDALEGVKVYPYHKRRGVCRYGDTSFIHGYHTGMYAAKNAAMCYGKVVMGHVHADDSASVARHEKVRGYTIGAMCKLDQKYNRAQAGTLRQNAGFAYGIKVGNTLLIHPAYPENGQWILPTAFTAYRAA